MVGSPVSFSNSRSLPKLIPQMVVPIVLFFLMMALPESPRWYILKARRLELQGPEENRLVIERLYEAAFEALRKLRNSKVQAARDLFHIDAWIIMTERTRSAVSPKSSPKFARILRQPWVQNTLALFQDDRCRRAMTAGLIVLSLQQLCGVNVLAYYSSSVFRDSLKDCTGLDSGCNLSQDRIALKVYLVRRLRPFHAYIILVLFRLRHHQFWYRHSSDIPHRQTWSPAIAAHDFPTDEHISTSDRAFLSRIGCTP